ncbi:hypothetical protein F0562_008728 [Nyssa sinensis]|uniref:RRM domain-containing protein n=1 Tax=Nyssa sinensis TaxID=561372 RepID=A0A5J5A808_9ASTE|nr:hypothetical protein F0562_008728 [Nyssa sinensis]
MDCLEASRIVYSRIRKLEPENIAKKITGYFLFHDDDMFSLALAPDHLIHKLIHNVKMELGFASKPAFSPPIPPSVNSVSSSDFPFPFTSFTPSSSRSSSLRVRDPQQQQPMYNLDFIPLGYSDSIPEDCRLQNQTQFMGLEDQLEPISPGISSFPNDYYYPEVVYDHLSATHPNPLLRLVSISIRGFASMEVAVELEIIELLKSRRGNPVSIASLPVLYYEKYGRTLQAEGYLSESQKHGKAGYSLTKLLAQLNNSIRIIGRPHGQHSVLLVQDAPKYMENRSERNDPGPIVSGSQHIYLTFPAESTFTQEDVSNYFNTFGPVQDVRIPWQQQKRMFGFVTFVSADSTRMILSKGNPHYVYGARVLVKPYREKSKLIDRRYSEKLEPPIYYHSHDMDIDSGLHSKKTEWESSRLPRKQLMEEHELALELQRRRFSELHVAQTPLGNQSYFGYSMDEPKISEAVKDLISQRARLHLL